jgi:two-component system OmpR family response regulator
MRILYVEEHAESSELLALWLGSYGYELVSANTLSDGLSLAKSGTFNIYILSGKFIDGTGLDLCRLIRQFDPTTSIVFYSALARDSDLVAAVNAGAQAYLIKPNDFEQIASTIKRLVDTEILTKPHESA